MNAEAEFLECLARVPDQQQADRDDQEADDERGERSRERSPGTTRSARSGDGQRCPSGRDGLIGHRLPRCSEAGCIVLRLLGTGMERAGRGPSSATGAVGGGERDQGQIGEPPVVTRWSSSIAFCWTSAGSGAYPRVASVAWPSVRAQ